ncbi:MAG TPA: hypothetical protein VM050_01150 [Patescibacteria group bacterium]|nr:hypothetical protein [Patescibacteria group bacterium]
MTRFELTGKPQVTLEAHRLMTNERLIVDVEPGCLWSAVKRDHEEEGVIFLGETRYALEAIIETERGAIGRSYKGPMEGYKLYLGRSGLEEVSRPVDLRDAESHGYSDLDDFKETANREIDELLGTRSVDRDMERNSSPDKGVLLWRENGKTCVAVVDAKGIVFTRGKRAFVLNEDNAISVQDGTVLIKNGKGERILLDRNGIQQPEVLRDIGARVAEAVEKSLSGFKASFSGRDHYPYDDREPEH